MDRVVYFLGAGFSAPLGLPLINNFYDKALDLARGEPERFQSVSAVFEKVRELSVIKNYFTANLFNFEELLSLLEMQYELAPKEALITPDDFADCIRLVISGYTPDATPLVEKPSVKWENHLWQGSKWQFYGAFAASLQGLRVEGSLSEGGALKIEMHRDKDQEFSYEVISLNYDTVLEYPLEVLRVRTEGSHEKIDFARSEGSKAGPQPRLAKLHGSVDSGPIIPPTWSKSRHPDVLDQWQMAFQILGEANHLRIMGYSLPAGDGYVQYLLKAAIARSEHLKSVDVICLDDIEHSVKKRFDSLFSFRHYRFASQDIEKYVSHVNSHKSVKRDGSNTRIVRFNGIERAHTLFMG